MQLGDNPNTRAALPIDGDQSLDANLKISANPEDARIDGAGGHCAGRKSV